MVNLKGQRARFQRRYLPWGPALLQNLRSLNFKLEVAIQGE